MVNFVHSDFTHATNIQILSLKKKTFLCKFLEQIDSNTEKKGLSCNIHYIQLYYVTLGGCKMTVADLQNKIRNL